MSRVISVDLTIIPDGDKGIFPSMPPSKESLQAYVLRQLREKGLSFKDVQRRSRARISAGYIGDVVQGIATNLTVDKLQALALGLGVSEDEIFNIARGKGEARVSLDEELFSLLRRFETLGDADKDEMRATLEMFDREIERRMKKKR